MLRLFLGLPLPPAVCAALVTAQFMLPLPRRVPAENFHLTLSFLGDVAPEMAAALDEELAAMLQGASPPRPFELELRGFGLFGDARPRAAWAGVLPSPPLMALQERCVLLARRAGIALRHQRFVPHVTLGNFPPPGAEAAMRLEHAVAGGQGFASPRWTAAEMVLWQSHLSGPAPRYSPLAVYPFS